MQLVLWTTIGLVFAGHRAARHGRTDDPRSAALEKRRRGRVRLSKPLPGAARCRQLDQHTLDDAPARITAPACSTLHAAEDGGLARVRLPGGRVTASQLEAIAVAARLGNGIVELTSRAQPADPRPAGGGGRGRCGSSSRTRAPALERARAGAQRAREPARRRHRSGVAPTDAIVAELDSALCSGSAFAALPGRFLFAVDDGSGLRARRGLRRRARRRARTSFRLRLAGRRRRACAFPRGTPLPGALQAALAFLELAAAQAARPWRVADLAGGTREMAALLGGRMIGERPLGRPADLRAGAPRPGRRARRRRRRFPARASRRQPHSRRWQPWSRAPAAISDSLPGGR